MKEAPKKNDKERDDFLRRAAKGELHDDFERDAAEGFSSLPNEDPREIMASTDRKMEATLYGQKKAVFVYWGMAAGLLLVLGLTVFLLRDSGTLDTERQLGEAGHARTDAVFRETPGTVTAFDDNISSRKEPAPVGKSKQNAEGGVATGEDAVKEADHAEMPAEQAAASKAVEVTKPEALPEVANAEPQQEADLESAAMEAPPQPARATGGEKKIATRTAPPSSAPAPTRNQQKVLQSGETQNMDFSSGGVPSLYACIHSELKKHLPANLQKKFSATALIRSGKITEIKFPRRSGLTGTQEKQADSVIKAIATPCVRDQNESPEQEIILNYEP